MNRPPVFLIAFLSVISVRVAAQTDPHITSWQTTQSARYARVWETAADKSSGNAVSTWPRSGLTNGGGGQATAAYSDIQRVQYSTNYVYITTTGLPSYTMGNWLTPTGQTYTSWPTNRAAIHRIPRTPTIPTTKQLSHGSGGVLVNGVFVWENGDAQSYTTSTGAVSMSGQGIWNRLAGVAEAFNFDTAYGHQPGSGAYHNHINPIALRYQLGDNVAYNSSTKVYSEASSITVHSPIIGWANDGLPIYGPYGYSSAMDATSGLRRMTSGFQKRDGTNGTVNLATTGRVTLPVWAASVQGRSQTLASTEYGPTTTATYTVAPGLTGTYSLGIFAEDYEYLGDVGKTQGVDFDLNRQNVRYCVTPEYPSGTYAYFVSIDATGATVFPDIINQEFFGSAPSGQGTVTSISETVTEYVHAGPAAAITLTGSASGGSVALTWNSAEGATYKVESSPDDATWTTQSSTVTSAGLSTNYTATMANYYRVTLTAIATYDTGGTSGTPVGTIGAFTYSASVTAPSITMQPVSSTVTAGTGVTFTVAASGTSPFTYQWKKDGVAITGGTSSSYAISSAQSTDAAVYTVVVTNSAGSATSSGATLTVNAAPTISAQPVAVSVVVGSAASFSVTATGTAPLAYQWRKDGVAIGGATSSTYSIASAQLSDAGSYTVVVGNSVGTVTSSAASLTVSSAAVAPSISVQPANTTVTVGSAATLSVTAGGTAPLSYQWRKAGVAISGATLATLTITSAQLSDAANYTVVVSNSTGSVTSASATLTVNAASVVPSITTQPAASSVLVGGSTSFTVVAGGTAPLTYQWRNDGVALSGAAAATYSISNAQVSDAGSYSVVVTNSAGSVTSVGATLSVSAVAVVPSITTQPSSASVLVGGAASFSVAASGTSPFTYQWKKNGAAISGATSATYSIATAQTTDAGDYVVAITNSAGSVTSTAATLTVSTVVIAPSIVTAPTATSVVAGATATFTVTAGGTAPFSFQWNKNGVPVSGATAATLSIANATASDAGGYSVTVNNSAGSATSAAVALSISANTARIMNLSTRAQAGGAAGTPIVGFVLSGTGTKFLGVRAVGPALTQLQVPNALSDPSLTLVSAGVTLASNDNWNFSDSAMFQSVGAFALQSGSKDAALIASLNGAVYSTPVGTNGGAGVSLVEIYDLGTASDAARLVNLSSRVYVGTGDQVVISGFVVSGEGSVRLLIRAAGPTLASYGVSDVLLDPQISLYQGQTVVATNNNWGEAADPSAISAAATTTGAFALNAGSKDAAMLVTLSEGVYSVVVSGVSSTTGTALVELYLVP